jgi:DNA mismatch repair protein MutL
MADIIKLLPDHVANQIAAGEVVQRPASVVKELIENSIDAQASEIQLVVKDSGKTLIQVIDNGIGMSGTDARMCFERHATSKIKTADDLFNLHTKGFRGEALASIAAIAHVELKTKQDGEELGSRLQIEGSKVISQEVAVTPNGTSISVKNLFFNIPARRNFLKSDAVETRHIIDEFHRIALAHPMIKFSMVHNDSKVFDLPVSNLRKRIVSIFGSRTNEKLVPVSEETEIIKVKGFIIKPEFSKRSRGEQFFFVNDRYVKCPYLHHAMVSAYEGLIKEGIHPGYFLYLYLDTKSIDINIHPTKTEVKFDNEQAIYAMIRSTVKHSLGQFSIAPVLDFDSDVKLDTPYEYHEKEASQPTIEVDRNFNPFKSTSYKKSADPSWEAMYVGLNSDEKNMDLEEIEFESEEVTGRLFDGVDEEAIKTTFQIQNKYIISPIKSGMLVINQHLAHQRVLYEELLKNITVKEALSQQLLFPISLNFSINDVEVLKQVKEQLEHTGFILNFKKDDEIEIRGIPVVMRENMLQVVLEQVIKDIKEEVPGTGFSQNDLLARSMSRNMAIKSGTPLNGEEQEHLINQLFACKEPSVSPTNKPVILTISSKDIDNKFN